MTLHAILALREYAAALHAPLFSSHGPFGWVLWIQPRGLVYEIGRVHGRFFVYFQRRA